jgi:uncharacterized membrane protein
MKINKNDINFYKGRAVCKNCYLQSRIISKNIIVEFVLLNHFVYMMLENLYAKSVMVVKFANIIKNILDVKSVKVIVYANIIKEEVIVRIVKEE